MAAVLEIVTILERTPITKEALEVSNLHFLFLLCKIYWSLRFPINLKRTILLKH